MRLSNEYGTDYDDVFSLLSYFIPWNDTIKNNYIEQYGLDLTLQIEMLVENFNDQLLACELLRENFIALKYDDPGTDDAPDLTDEDLTLLTDEDLTQLTADSTRRGGILTDEDYTHLTDEDYEELMDDATISEDYLGIFKSLYNSITLILYIQNNDLFDFYQQMFDNAFDTVDYTFKVGAYKHLKALFDTIYTDNFKGVFDYNTNFGRMTINTITEEKINTTIADSAANQARMTREQYNLQVIENTENINIQYVRPIVLYFNRYEMSNINGWDGNKLETGDGTYLLAPQVGAGAKEDDNSFTGIVMGQRNLQNISSSSENNQIGIFGYHKGVMSMFLNAREGSAIFGKAGSGGQIIIDPEASRGMIYSGSFWTNYNSTTGLPSSYSRSNQSGHGLLIDFTNAKIYAGNHDQLQSDAVGFFLNEDGLSIGSRFKVAADGSMRLGAGASAGSSSDEHCWTIDTRTDIDDGISTTESYIAFGGNERYDADNPNPYTCAKVYIGTDGISIGTNFTVDKEGNLKIGGGSIGGDSIGGWWIYDDYLASNNWKETDGQWGIKLDSRNDIISLGSDNAKIYSGDHDALYSTADGFYLDNNGLSIGSTFRVAYERFPDSDEYGYVLHCDRGYIGDYEIMYAEEGGGSVRHSYHAWKLRTGKMKDSDDENEKRYYTYMTTVKQFIASNSELDAHNATNDVTDDCSIGSYSYPWGKGYFNKLRLSNRTGGYVNVTPEGITLEIEPEDWQSTGAPYNLYYADKVVMGVQKLGHNLLIDCYPRDEEDYKPFNKSQGTVFCKQKNHATFIASSVPIDENGNETAIQVLLTVEEYLTPVAEGAVLEAEYDNETNTLSCLWNSPDDSSVFIEWQSDTIIIERKNEITGNWEIIDELTQTFTDKNIHKADPLIYGPSA